jgi:predicted ribosome quality control (RQC) complex YloA/Tae2 family protein
MKYIKSFFESKNSDKPKVKKHDIDGFVVFQGKDAASNEHLTLEIANEDDIWMHAKGVPGSHVIIKVKDKVPTETTIKRVAMIAAKNSKSTEDMVKVVYCKKKYVTKESGMNTGQVKVDYINANEIIVPKN